MNGVRIDRWLWAARFFKTRAQAKTAIDAGHVELNGHRAKAAKEVTVGATVEVRKGGLTTTVEVRALAERRGSATVAATLYEETVESVEARQSEVARRRMERAGLRVPASRPDKRDRQAIKDLKQSSDP